MSAHTHEIGENPFLAWESVEPPPAAHRVTVVLRPAHAATAAALLTAVNCMNIHVPGQGAKVQGQFQTDCKKAQEAALLCATTHPEERQRCDKFFAAYRECRKAEHSRILEARGQGR